MINWISVKERLPENWVPVIFWDKKKWHTGWYGVEYWVCENEMCHCKKHTHKPTHWSDIQPPEEKP